MIVLILLQRLVLFSLRIADVVIVIGARLNWMLSYGDAPQFNPHAKFIQLDIDATQFDSSKPIGAPAPRRP